MHHHVGKTCSPHESNGEDTRTSVPVNRTRTNMTLTQKARLNTPLPCPTPDTIMSSSSLCFSTISSNCHVDDDDVYSGSGGGSVSTIRLAVLHFDDGDDENNEENETFQKGKISPINFFLVTLLIPFMYNRSSSSSLYRFKIIIPA
mmetsp:Transcript_43182/g.43890  ORF Transcript_43182/g.43890 Transcript_43182/m.43890 type:complete len:146 (-) Transcript_43182:187-624(-)